MSSVIAATPHERAEVPRSMPAAYSRRWPPARHLPSYLVLSGSEPMNSSILNLSPLAYADARSSAEVAIRHARC